MLTVFLASMDLVIGAVIMAAFVLLGIVLARAPVPEEDTSPVSDVFRRKREEFLQSSVLARILDPWVRVLATAIPSLGLNGHARQVGRLLLAAGNPRGYQGAEYVAYGLLNAILAWAATFLLFLLAGDIAIFLPILLGLMVYWFLYSNLSTAARQRRIRINRQIPYFLDLASLTMAAGATFTQACQAISAGPLRGPLEDELALMLHEMQAGTPLAQSLANMGERTESEDLDSVIRAVRQGDRLGTPLTDIFKTQAEMNRFRRSQRAEQEAGKLPNRLSIPNTILIFASLLILFGPMIVKAVRGEGM